MAERRTLSPAVRTFIGADGLWRPLKGYFEHAHPWWEIVFYTHGTGTLFAREKEILFSPGTVVCIPPKTPHREKARTVFRNMWVAITRLETADLFPIFQISPQHPVFSLIPILHVESKLHRPSSELIVAHLFQVFMLYLEEWLATDPQELMIQQLKRKIIAGMNDPQFQLHEAMAEVPLSRDHLRRLFLDRVGVGPKRYLTDLRMQQAREHLRLGWSIKETAKAVGFPDPYHFSRVFRQTQGISPREYKRHG